ncbi:MAG: YbjQ family protein [Bacteroidetes bacterium]|nr:YbjQ family protein [Bacteroidota bacterium]
MKKTPARNIVPVKTNIMLTTSTHLEGYRITGQLGLVRGITVRSRGLGGNFVGGIMALFGGRNSIYTELCENTREEALQLMIQHAGELGANAIINMRYDANEVMSGITEVLAYGTAVVAEPA